MEVRIYPTIILHNRFTYNPSSYHAITYDILQAFMPVIESQGTPEQVQKWLGAAKRHAIIGCYAQTELRYAVCWLPRTDRISSV